MGELLWMVLSPLSDLSTAEKCTSLIEWFHQLERPVVFGFRSGQNVSSICSID